MPLKGKGQRDLWDKFLDKKKRKLTISWREYLLLMAGFDPLAVALVVGYRKIFAELRLDKAQSYSPNRPQYLPTFAVQRQRES